VFFYWLPCARRSIHPPLPSSHDGKRREFTNPTPHRPAHPNLSLITPRQTRPHNDQTTVYSTALAIKERIYGNRVVLFAPLYLANYCVNTCRYCAFACTNKTIERTALTDDQVRAEVEALERQGHRRLLVLTGEHPRYDFDTFLHALGVIADVKTEPCGNIRRMNVEIPSLSVSDMRRLKATNHVGTYTLFQEVRFMVI
jgi:2-iminoacetate synthase ThiH